MRRKAALFMATLMAGSSLSGSYVSAASIEGMPEENVQTEEVSQENEAGESSDFAEDLSVSEEGWQEDLVIEAESEPENISVPEADLEDSSILAEEPYHEEEQLIEGEPVVRMEEAESETPNADLETQDAVPEEAEETAQEYNYDALPGDDALLPGWVYDIRPVSVVGVREAGSEEEWDWRNVDITEVRILNDDNGILQYTPLEEGADLVAQNENGHYCMEIRRDADGGEARVQITCDEQDKAREDPVHVVKEFTVWAVEGRYDTDYSYMSGDNTMLPGSEMEIATSLYHSWYDPAEDRHNGNPVEDYTIELIYNEENAPTWDADLISAELEEDQRTIRVTAGNNPGAADIPIRYMVTDENGEQSEVGQETVHVEVAEDFYTIEPVSLDEAVRNCNVGDVVDFNEFQITTQHWVKDGEDIQTMALVDQDQSEIRYYTEYDEEAWERLDNPEDGYGLPVLKRISCGNTNVGIFAEKKFVSEDEAEEWQTVAGRSYNFEEKQYNIELSFTGADRLYYGERGTGALTVVADTEGMDGLKDYQINWEVTQYRADQPEEVSCAEVKVSEDGTECIVTAREDLDTDEYFNLGIYVTVMKDGIEVAATDIDIPVMPTELDLGRLPQDDVLLPDWEYTVDREYQIWRKDARYPDGENVPVQITGVRVLQNENDVLSYDCSEDAPQTVRADENGYYHLHAIRDNTQIHGGEAIIEFDYMEPEGLENPQNAEMYISGTKTFRIWVDAQKYNTGYEYENGSSLLLPGSDMTITTSLSEEWYDIDEDCHGGQEIKEYTIELQQYNEDGTPSWDTNLVEAEIDKENSRQIHVTAKDTGEGETDIPIRYLIGEDEVGMEWIHVAVYRQFCIIEPGYLTGEDGERINPYIGDTLNLADAGIQTYNYSTEKEEKEAVEDVRYRVEYDDNAWKVVDPGQIVDGYGLPELQRTGNWGTDVTVVAERAENGEEIARQSYWFDGYDYFSEYVYSMNEEKLNYGHFYTDGVPLQVTLSVEPGLPEDAAVEWKTVIYDEAGNESEPGWITLTEDEQDPCKVQVTLSESAEKEQHIDDGFDLRAVVKVGDNELTSIGEWINLQDVQFNFQIPRLLYLTGNEPDPMEFRNTDWWALEQQNGTCPNGKSELVKVVKVSEICEKGQELLSITDTDEGISVTPLDDEKPGETAVRIGLEYKDGTSAGTVDIPVYIQESVTGLDEVQFDSDGTETQLLPGQTMGITVLVRNYRRNGKVLESTDLKEGEDYTVEFCDYNTDIVEYQEDGRFHAKGRGNTWITLRIRDMEGNEITSYNFEVQVTGSYFKAEQGESEERMLTAGGSGIEIPYSLRRYSISNPEGYDVEPDNVVLDSTGDTPGLHISYKEGKIMAALDKDAELEAGEMRETCMQLAFLDEEENVLTESGFTVMLHKHDMQTVVDKKATCGAAGSQHKECTVCHTKEKATAIPATGKHTMQTIVDKKATCGAAGSQHKECKVCHVKEKATTIPATGKHKFGSYKVTKAATVLAKGIETRTCSICGKKENREIAKIPGTIKLTVTNLPLQVGKSVELSKIVTGLTKGDSIVSYATSNQKAATVSNKGKVTGKAAGTAKITIRLASGKTAAVTITVQKNAVATASITNLSKTLTLKLKETKQLSPVISPITTTDKVTYKTSDKNIVTVSAKGVLTAKKAGKAKVTVQSGKKSAVITVTVTAPAPTGMNNIPTAKTLAKGKSFVLKPTLVPSGAQAKISYTTSNKKVATVDAKGKVTAKGKGKAVITITAGKVKKTCTVTVK